MPARPIIAASAAQAIAFTPIFDSTGRIHQEPAGWVQQLQAQGITRVTVELLIPPPTVDHEWLTRREAATRLRDESDLTLQAAEHRIDRAAAAGQIKTIEQGKKTLFDAAGVSTYIFGFSRG